MSFRSLRETRYLSQEKLAEMSGLSLRTVQRLEAGHRVSYASLRALAAAFNLDVDQLERELYATRPSAGEFVEKPRWVRRLGNGLSMGATPLDRCQAQRFEAISMALGVLFLLASPLPDSAIATMTLRVAGILSLACGYVVSVASRLLDAYLGWPDGDVAVLPGRPAPTFMGRVVAYTLALLLAVVFLLIVSWLAGH